MNKEFDQRTKKYFGEQKEQPPPHFWDQLESQLPTASRGFFVGKGYMIVVFGVLVVGIGMLLLKDKKPDKTLELYPEQVELNEEIEVVENEPNMSYLNDKIQKPVARRNSITIPNENRSKKTLNDHLQNDLPGTPTMVKPKMETDANPAITSSGRDKTDQNLSAGEDSFKAITIHENESPTANHADSIEKEESENLEKLASNSGDDTTEIKTNPESRNKNRKGDLQLTLGTHISGEGNPIKPLSGWQIGLNYKLQYPNKPWRYHIGLGLLYTSNLNLHRSSEQSSYFLDRRYFRQELTINSAYYMFVRPGLSYRLSRWSFHLYSDQLLLLDTRSELTEIRQHGTETTTSRSNKLNAYKGGFSKWVVTAGTGLDYSLTDHWTLSLQGGRSIVPMIDQDKFNLADQKYYSYWLLGTKFTIRK